jgi:hypothetical protein
MSREASLLITPNRDLDRDVPICPWSTVLTAWSQTLGRSVVVSVGCKRWSCPFCGRNRIISLAKRVEAAKPNRLVTLTTNPAHWDNPRHAFDGTRRSLGAFCRTMRARGEWEQLRVLEVTKKGWPHYHLMVRSPYVPHAIIRDRWAELTSAKIVDVRQVKKRDNVYWYLVKYLAKQDYCEFTTRRLSWSKNFFPPKEKRETLGLIGIEREACNLHTWLRYNHTNRWITRVTSYAFTIS